MSGLTSGLNPDLVKTELDALFKSDFNAKPGPNVGDVLDGSLFKQRTAKNSGINSAVMDDGGQWTQRTNEQQDIAEASIISGQKRNRLVTNYSQSIPVPKHFMDDEDWDAVRDSISKQAKKGRLTDRVNGFKIYRDAFDATTTNSGANLISDSHTNLNGDTISNKITAELTPDSLNTLMTMLIEQKDQSGDIVGHEGTTLLVSASLYKTAVEVTESKLEANTTDNQKNVFSAKYGIKVVQSQYIGTNAGGNGSNTAFFLLSDDHSVIRWERKAIETGFTPWQLTKNFTNYFKAEFRNVYGAISYEGIVGSDGTT